jgi:hypothetical protein
LPAVFRPLHPAAPVQRKIAVSAAPLPVRSSVIQRVKIRIDNWSGGKGAPKWREVETNGLSLAKLGEIRDLVHQDDREKYNQAVRFRAQFERPESEQRELQIRHNTPRPVLEVEDSTRSEFDTLSRANALDKQRRLGLYATYHDFEVLSDKGDELIPSSETLSSFNQGGFVTTGKITLASTAIDKVSTLADSHLIGVSTALNVGYSGYQTYSLGELANATQHADLKGAIEVLNDERLKTTSAQAVSGGASVATGFVVGSAVGTSIPVPVLGTLVGGLVGAIGGFAVKKAVEIPTTKLLQNKRTIAGAVITIHDCAKAGDPQALAVFSTYGIPADVARASDGWKALMDKTGGDFGGRS